MGLREWWRARREPVEFPEQWRSVLESCLAPWPQLSDDERDRLEQLTLALIYGKRAHRK
ncbi:MAG: hypothetical protein KDB24_15885 [Microthrixaceae bacterium]|nr:hypothetical protein [Microthrixaceae bacterium]